MRRLFFCAETASLVRKLLFLCGSCFFGAKTVVFYAKTVLLVRKLFFACLLRKFNLTHPSRKKALNFPQRVNHGKITNALKIYILILLTRANEILVSFDFLLSFHRMFENIQIFLRTKVFHRNGRRHEFCSQK